MENAILEILRKGNDIHEFTSEIAEMMTAWTMWINSDNEYTYYSRSNSWVFENRIGVVRKTIDELFTYWKETVYKKQ
jgi:hypothetical protein